MGITYQISGISDIYIIICNSSKLQFEIITKIILWLGVTTRGAELKGHNINNVENHWSRGMKKGNQNGLSLKMRDGVLWRGNFLNT